MNGRVRLGRCGICLCAILFAVGSFAQQSDREALLNVTADIDDGFFQINVFREPNECQLPYAGARLTRNRRNAALVLPSGSSIAIEIIYNYKIGTGRDSAGKIVDKIRAGNEIIEFKLEANKTYELSLRQESQQVGYNIVALQDSQTARTVIPLTKVRRIVEMTHGLIPKIVKSCVGNERKE
jgi:hypothetical protein